MRINWKIRFQSYQFWVAAVSALILLSEQVAAIFGYTLNLGDLGNQIAEVIRTIFVLLALFGVVTDPTTPGIGDSPRALSRKKITE